MKALADSADDLGDPRVRAGKLVGRELKFASLQSRANLWVPETRSRR
jgi:hypothetical protein